VTKAGFEDFNDNFVVGSKLPRMDVMLSPTLTIGAVRLTLPHHSLPHHAAVSAVETGAHLQLRVVLSWGANPRDLDIWMTTPTGRTQPIAKALC
jgi:hypothetical protein